MKYKLYKNILIKIIYLFRNPQLLKLSENKYS